MKTGLRNDDRLLDELINIDGYDQLTACRIVWAPHLLPAWPFDEPAPDAPLVEQLAWARWRAREIVRDRMAAVLRWLGIESDPLAIYRHAKESQS